MCSYFGILKKYVFNLTDFQSFQESTISNFFLYGYPVKRLVFGPRKIAIFCGAPQGSQHSDSKIIESSKFQKCHCMFCKRYLYQISKHPFMFFHRYLSHIYDVGDFIKRIFGISRCPSFPKLPTSWKSRYELVTSRSGHGMNGLPTAK